MKREISFFKDHRAKSANALLDTMRALGMSDAEIKAELMAYQRRQRVMVHIPSCPKCGSKGFDVTSDELADAGGVIACDYCETLITPEAQA